MSAADSDSVPALTLAGITKRFGAVTANDDVSMAVTRGEVHALVGENGAGKTTLMNCVFGLLSPDAGRIEVRGRKARISNPRQALDLGIGMVHQNVKLVPDMTVVENAALGASRRGLRSRLSDVAQAVRDIASRTGFVVDPNAAIGELSIGGKQRVEIVKLLIRGADILILDEPTSVLTPQEWEELSDALRALVGRGSSVVFITHKLDELFAIADRYTVLRDGRVVGCGSVAQVTKPELVRQMVGRDVTLRASRPRVRPGAPVLEAEGLHTAGTADTSLNGVSFTLHEGEILGVAGVDGNGQGDLVETLSGLRSPTAGAIRIAGNEVHGLTPERFVALGGGVVSEDRQRNDLALDLSVLDNLMLRDFSRAPFAKHGVLDYRAMRAHAREAIEPFDVRTPSLDAPVRQLSGGNQQKLVIARELRDSTRVLIASQPTRGLDVGVTQAVYEVLNTFKESGGATLLISAELDEILSLSDRIAVLVRGRLAGIVTAEEATVELLGLLMSGDRPVHGPTPPLRGVTRSSDAMA